MANLATCITPRISSSHIAKVLAPFGGLRAGGNSLTVAAINNQQLWQTFISKVPF